MDAYAGFEPQVGEIRAVRTFRVGPGGVLFPLFSNRAWTDGINSASCRISRSPVDGTPHRPAEPDCTCGFYAYASETAAGEYPNARYVLAVIACWGRVVAGTRGVRAEHARIEAIWMSPIVPPDLAAGVTRRYPSVSTYADRAAMLAEHPPTVLDCYDTPAPARRAWRRFALWLVAAVALVVGVLPARWLGSDDDARIVWATLLAFFAIGAFVLRHRHTDVAARRRSLLFMAMTLWLVAPFTGAIGIVLLRLPLIQLAVLFAAHRVLLDRAARTFPAEVG
jgi:hypothetical protein